jgi:hypothetical protein
MEALSKKFGLSTKEKNSSSSKKSMADTTFFDKAKSLFPLDKRAEAGTERAWETYTTNRVAAEKRFRGPKEKGSKSVTDEEGENVHDDNEEEDEYEYGDYNETNALNLIRENMAILEEDLYLDEGVLSKSFRLLACDALFEEEDQVISFVDHAYFYR